MTRSVAAKASSFPSALKDIEVTVLAVGISFRDLPVNTSHDLISLVEPLKRILSVTKSNECTVPECPPSVRKTVPVFTSHNLTVPSLLPLAANCPFGLTATARTTSEWFDCT